MKFSFLYDFESAIFLSKKQKAVLFLGGISCFCCFIFLAQWHDGEIKDVVNVCFGFFKNHVISSEKWQILTCELALSFGLEQPSTNASQMSLLQVPQGQWNGKEEQERENLTTKAVFSFIETGLAMTSSAYLSPIMSSRVGSFLCSRTIIKAWLDSLYT